MHLSVNAIRREDTVARSFQQFASQGSQTLQSQFVRSQVLESRESTNGRFRFIETHFECVVDTIKVRNLLRYIDGGDIWIEARVWGPASVVQENTALAQQTFDSIEPVQ